MMEVELQNIEACRHALDCYVTFKATIERTGIKDKLSREVAFEFFGENYSPPVGDLFHGLN